MSSYPDMTPCGFLDDSDDSPFIAVGWLAADQQFTTGSVTLEFYEQFKRLMAVRFWPPGLPISGAVATCPFCQFDGAMGNATLFVPDGQRMFIAPELAVHYVATHRYQPPSEFVDAVMRCPLPGTRDYRVQFLRAGGRSLMATRPDPAE